MASDRGIKAMLEEDQLKPPMQFNPLESGIEMSNFMKSVYRLANDSVFDIQAQGALFRKGGLALVNNQGYFTKSMGAANPNDRKDAEDIYLANYDYVSDDVRWQYFLTAAGIQI